MGTVEIMNGSSCIVKSRRSVVTVKSGNTVGVPYDGPYEVVPTEEPQVLQTLNKTMKDNLTVGAIPQNYGRIAWDGAGIMVY